MGNLILPCLCSFVLKVFFPSTHYTTVLLVQMVEKDEIALVE